MSTFSGRDLHTVHALHTHEISSRSCVAFSGESLYYLNVKNGGLQHLTPKEAESVEELAKALKSALGESLISITFFGSKVRGNFHTESDIDLLIILKERTTTLEGTISHVWLENELQYDSRISYVIYSEYEFAMNKKLGSPFVESIELEGLSL